MIEERPANPHLATGKIGMLMNVLTYPEYRRKGVATEMLKRLIAIGKSRNLSYIELFATESGRPLYEKAGFVAHDSEYTGMKLNPG